ncbi:MAG: hypothetical protein QNJ60_17335 [Xenococcaceae cyanobacterium MO_188.B19]|nr:hypothetical protein [Xenococcaceae cyanobacterium MO_188.B19]
MYHTSLPLHAEFDIVRLKLHLEEHPEQAQQIAIDQFTYHLEVLEENHKLEQKLQSISLPSLPQLNNIKLQNEYNDLLEQYTKLLNSYGRVTQENQKLRETIEYRTNEQSPIPSFLRKLLNL